MKTKSVSRGVIAVLVIALVVASGIGEAQAQTTFDSVRQQPKPKDDKPVPPSLPPGHLEKADKELRRRAPQASSSRQRVKDVAAATDASRTAASTAAAGWTAHSCDVWYGYFGCWFYYPGEYGLSWTYIWPYGGLPYPTGCWMFRWSAYYAFLTGDGWMPTYHNSFPESCWLPGSVFG